jgi:hypothetical protein
MGQKKGNPTPSYQNQAYETLRPNTNARENRNYGTTPVMLDDETNINDYIDNISNGGFVKDSDLTNANLDIDVNTLTTNIVYASSVEASSNGVGENFKVGDDVWIGDMNASNTMVISGIQNPTAVTLQFGSGSQPSISHLVTGAPFPAVGSTQAITGSLIIGHTGHLYFYNGQAGNGGWATII